MSKPFILGKAMLIVLSVMTTFLFLLGAGTGVSAVLIACAAVILQLFAMLFMPGMIRDYYLRDNLVISSLTALFVLMLILLSVYGSVSVLNTQMQTDIHIMQEQSELNQLIQQKLQVVDRYIELDRLKLAKPFQDDVLELREALKNLPEISGFYTAAITLLPDRPAVIVTIVTVTLAILLDAGILLLSIPASACNHSVQNVMLQEYCHSESEQKYIPEIEQVKNALIEGTIPRCTVKNVRELLKCGQDKAADVARIFRQLEIDLEP